MVREPLSVVERVGLRLGGTAGGGSLQVGFHGQMPPFLDDLSVSRRQQEDCQQDSAGLLNLVN
jgi:hypothetical protein